MFKIIKKISNFYLDKNLIYFLFLFFLLIKPNILVSNDKIYLDLSSIKFENKINYKNYKTSTQLLTETNLNEDIKNWVERKIILKGNSGELIVQILDESLIDSYVEDHSENFGFLSNDGIAYIVNFKIKLKAENLKNNAYAEVLSIVKGEKIFIGTFSINDRSKAVDELMRNMIKKLKKDIRKEMDKEFKDFLANKYN